MSRTWGQALPFAIVLHVGRVDQRDETGHVMGSGLAFCPRPHAPCFSSDDFQRRSTARNCINCQLAIHARKPPAVGFRESKQVAVRDS